MLEEDAIGELLDTQVAYLQGRGLVQPGAFRDPLSDLGAHLFDALHWWGGPLARLAAFEAEGPADLPPSWSLAGTFATGATVSMSVSRVAAGRGNALLATLSGRRGALRLIFDVEAVSVSRAAPGATAWEEVPIPSELQLDYAAFPRVHWDRIVGALRGEEPFPTFAEGLRVQEVIEAAQRSAANRRSLGLPLDSP
jgi:predicted dehydrogenase